MSFKDFITNRWFRRKIAADLERFNNIKPPANPSERYIRKLVEQLRHPKRARFAKRELSLIDPRIATPILATALRDERFHQLEWEQWSHVSTPLESLLELLVPAGGDHIIEAAPVFVASPESKKRKLHALALASLGRGETLPMLKKLLSDEDSFVRSYVVMGIGRAIDAEVADAQFRDGAYSLLLERCQAISDCAEVMLAMDRDRAAADFASPRLLNSENRYAFKIIEACNNGHVALPVDVIKGLIADSMPKAIGKKCYPHQYVVSAGLKCLTIALGEKARPIVEGALGHEHEQVYKAAAACVAMLAGLDDPIGFVIDRENEVGFDGLTGPQRVVYCASVFDFEVCNGGLMQFFGNSSGDHALETLEALQVLKHCEAANALSAAMKLVGPLAREPDREMRLAAFEDRFETLKAAFDPLEVEYYRTDGELKKKVLLYAIEHADHFR